MSEKPATKSSAWMSASRRARATSSSDIPVMKVMQLGMSGSTQGERKLASPAPKAIGSAMSEPNKPSAGAAGSGGNENGGDPRLRSGGHRFLEWYFALKYRVFRRERRPDDGRRGLVMLQIDALAYVELRRAIELGYCP